MLPYGLLLLIITLWELVIKSLGLCSYILFHAYDFICFVLFHIYLLEIFCNTFKLIVYNFEGWNLLELILVRLKSKVIDLSLLSKKF
jgi:hypothetical protein